VSAITPLIGRILVETESGINGDRDRALYIFHNRPISRASYEPVSQRLLPLDADWATGIAQLTWPTKLLPKVVGDEEETFRALIREYLFVSLFKSAAESLAAENASRLVAMQRAEKNIDELVDNLTRTFQRLRQNSIDEELFDVVSGYESLSRSRKDTN
jgi:F-type H+-transporting ATPase subunit gamma